MTTTTTLSTNQKLLLLQSAVSQPFTSKAALLTLLASQYPQIDFNEIETFLDDLVDFDLVDTKIFNSVSSVTHSQAKVVTAPFPSSAPSSAPSPPPSSAPAPVPSPPPSSAPPPPPYSPPHLVPVRTPSGRTLRSNSTVNTSEPRKLRSSK
jgi:hypothetical protein